MLPKAVPNGSAWEPTRSLIRRFDLLYVISSHEAGNWNFSESTNLSEVLLVMKKTENPSEQETVFVNLWEQPRTSAEAVTLVRAIESVTPANLQENAGTSELRTNGHKYGEMIALSLRRNPDISWVIPAAFAQTDLCRSAFHLSKGSVSYPGMGLVGKIPLVRLDAVTELGPDGRDVDDGFSLTESPTPYRAYWGYDAESVQTLRQASNQYLNLLTRARPRRHLRSPNLLWSRAGSLMLPKELRLTTSCLSAVVLPHRALSNVWWPAGWLPGDDKEQREMERRLALWFNSTLGLFQLLMQRQETEGPWSKFSKAWYEELRVLDLRALSAEHLKSIDDLWDSVSDRRFLRMPDMATDPVRSEIDETFATILGIPPLGDFRDMLAREPLFTRSAI